MFSDCKQPMTEQSGRLVPIITQNVKTRRARPPTCIANLFLASSIVFVQPHPPSLPTTRLRNMLSRCPVT